VVSGLVFLVGQQRDSSEYFGLDQEDEGTHAGSVQEVDGIAVVEKVEPEGDSLRVDFRVPEALAAYIAEKGSITIDGASLTVNAVEHDRFGVNLIPHTRQVTTARQRHAPVHTSNHCVGVAVTGLTRTFGAPRDEAGGSR